MIGSVTAFVLSLLIAIDVRPYLSRLDYILWAVLVLGGLGFGPKIAGFTRGGTEYLLSAIPLGGYVKMLGEDPKEEVADLERSFSAKPIGWRSLIILAGPGSNFP